MLILTSCSRDEEPVKPAAFLYHQPRFAADAIALLSQLGGSAKVLAGGQSLVPLMNRRVATPAALIDINGVAGLDYLRDEDGDLRVGATTRYRTAEIERLVPELSILHDAIGMVGSPQVRSRGTIGGAIYHANPAGEMPLVATTLAAKMVISSVRGQRVVTAHEFFVDAFVNVCLPDELLLEIRFPHPPSGATGAFLEFGMRDGDLPLVAVAVVAKLDGQGRCEWVRIGLGGVASTPVRSVEAEAVLLDRRLDAEAIRDAALAAADGVVPPADVHATSAFRVALVNVLVARALTSLIAGDPAPNAT
jgi:carbon-monoxide dehydrogenase medium subunit